MVTDDEIFTEHALDTKEDEMQEVKVNGFFGGKKESFIKLEGFNVKKKESPP